MTEADDLARLQALVRRVLRSAGSDLDAVEELVFVQQWNDPLGVTTTTDPLIELTLLQQAFDAELGNYIAELLADDKLTREEIVRLRSSLDAASGRLFEPAVAIAPYEQILLEAHRRDV